jgi:hypothetical protein
MIPEWWSRCQGRMRWETPEQGSARERISTLCIRIAQYSGGQETRNRIVNVREIEGELLQLLNHIQEQCFPHAPKFSTGDLRYQGFEDREGKGRGMVTINRRKVTTFEVDAAMRCILGLFLGNGIQAGSGRAYKWSPFALIAQDSGGGLQEGNDVDMKDMAEQATWTKSAAQMPPTIGEHGEQRNRRAMRKIIMSQGPWYDEESTVAWERYMQTEGLCQYLCCQYCQSTHKPVVVVTPGGMEQRRQTVCFCTSCLRFTCKHHGKEKVMDMTFFRQMNPDTGKFYRVLPYAEDEHPRRIRGPVRPDGP